MTEEQLKHANGIRSQIEAVQNAKYQLDQSTRLSLSDQRNYATGTVNVSGPVYFEKVSNEYIPDIIKDQVREQFIKAIQRSKRILENFSHDLKNELEDL